MTQKQAWELIEEMTIEYSERGDGSDLGESIILAEHEEKFDECLNVLGFPSIGHDELSNGRICMIHDMYG
jgi:hypothetical protein